MRIKTTPINDNEIKLVLTADEKLLESSKRITVERLGRSVKVTGFRPGKAPSAMIERSIDPDTLQSEFLDHIVNRMYGEAVRTEKLRPVANPEVKLTKFVPFTELEIEAVVTVIGPVSLPDYAKLRKALPKVTVTANDVSGVLSSLQRRQATKLVVERAAKPGDEVTIDFDGTDAKGKPVAGASAKDYPLLLGSDNFIPGFEPEIVGLKAGDNKKFDVTFPADYQVKSLAKQKVTFQVAVHAVSELTPPALDDAFAAQVGPVTTLKELKADIKKQLEYEAGAEARKQFENELITEIASAAQVAIPSKLIEEQVRQNEDDERRNLVYRGQTWQEHLDEEGVTEAEHRERQRPVAEQSLKANLVLTEIADKEGITVTPEELEIRIQILKGQYTDKEMRAELDKPENRRDIEGRLQAEKTMQFLTDLVTKVNQVNEPARTS